MAGHLVEQQAKGRIFDTDQPANIFDPLHGGMDERATGRMAMNIDRPFIGREVPRAHIQHRLHNRLGPSPHTDVKQRVRFGHGIAARAINFAVTIIHLDVILVRRDCLALEPDRRAHRAVVVERVARPVMLGIVEIEPAGIGHVADLVAALAAERPGQPFDGAPVRRTAMHHEDGELFSVRSNGDLRRVFRLVNDIADIPV